MGCSVVEAFGDKPKPQELEQVLRSAAHRRAVLKHKFAATCDFLYFWAGLQWADAMAAQGSGGAYEISQRMTAMIGWGGTANFKEDWAYDQARLERISVLETALVFSLPAQTNCNVGGQ